MNGKTILDRKVSVQLARKPEPAQEGNETAEPARRRSSTRGRGRGRGRGGRAGRGRVSHTTQKSFWSHTNPTQGRNAEGQTTDAPAESIDGPTNVPGQVLPLTDTTNEALSAAPGDKDAITVDPSKTGKTDALRPRKQRGPPEDGVPSKTKVMVANLPYDLREEKVSFQSPNMSRDHSANLS